VLAEEEGYKMDRPTENTDGESIVSSKRNAPAQNRC
jgi:hypothetical protein